MYTRKKSKISKQVKARIKKESKPKRIKKYDGDTSMMISTGSTLLDLAISGGRVRGGGIPAGIFVEIFGPAGTGKTVLLAEIAGDVKRKGGQVMFKDPEARLDKKFARLFGLEVDKIDYDRPNTVPQVFKPIRKWEPVNLKVVNGAFTDSLAALSTDMELDEKDQYGMRRAKEFSEELRKTCRVIADKNFLLVASNQVRENIDAGKFEQKYTSPGGMAPGFYASLRLRMMGIKKIPKEIKVRGTGKIVKRIVGVTATIEVFKSSVWQPFRQAPITILFDYGIDDIRQNLQFIKDYTKNTTYAVGKSKLGQSMEDSIRMVEDQNLEEKLREEVIDLWEDIEDKFKTERKQKVR